MRGTSILSNNWDKKYIDLAKHIATWSKDPSTKIGAVAIGEKGQVLAQGYNGFPRGIDDSATTRLAAQAYVSILGNIGIALASLSSINNN